MCALKQAFQAAANMAELERMILNDEPPPIPHVSDDVNSLIRHAFEGEVVGLRFARLLVAIFFLLGGCDCLRDGHEYSHDALFAPTMATVIPHTHAPTHARAVGW